MKFFLSILFILFPLLLNAQSYKLTGKIMDQAGTPVDLVNILILDKERSYITGTMNDTTGVFSFIIPKGNYILSTQRVGYKKWEKEFFLNQDKYLNDIILHEEDLQLEEVVISAARPMVRREVDRLVFDANSIIAGNTNGLDILQNVPGILILDDEIKILGKEGVKVLINDREIKMSGKDLLTFLRTYHANDIDKIEVITSPPAKYDAEGDAGILNILIKKMPNDYIGGTLTYEQSYTTYHKDDFSSTLNFNKDKITSNFSFSGGIGKDKIEETHIQYFPAIIRDSKGKTITKAKYANLRGSIDYEVNKNLMIGIQAFYNKNTPDRTSPGKTFIYSPNTLLPDSILDSNTKKDISTTSHVVNFHTDYKLDSLGKSLRFDIEYFKNQNITKEEHSSFHYDLKGNLKAESQFNFKDNNSIQLEAISSSLDFVLPFLHFTINTGTKLSLSEIQNKIEYQYHTFPQNQDNNFLYKENIFAVYGDINRKINDFFSVKGGVRIEYTYTKSSYEIPERIDTDKYIKLFPTLFAGYNPNQNHSFNLTLSSRISRPGFRYLNPFALYGNQYERVYGKPDLQPSTLYKTNLGYTFKNNFTIEAYYFYLQNDIAQVTDMDVVTLISKTKWENALSIHNTGINNYYYFTEWNWLQSFLLHGLYYQKSISHSEYTVPTRSGFHYVLSINNRFFLNNKRNLIGQLNGNYMTKQLTAATILNPYYNLNIGLQYTLLNDNLRLGAYISNLFVSNISGTANSNGMEMTFDNKYAYRTFKISVSYNLGAKLSGKRREYSSSDLQNRL